MTAQKHTPAFEASTMVDFKAKAREVMGWPDRRSWTAAERTAFKRSYEIKVDLRRNVICAIARAESHPNG